jgi:hypothetical protein
MLKIFLATFQKMLGPSKSSPNGKISPILGPYSLHFILFKFSPTFELFTTPFKLLTLIYRVNDESTQLYFLISTR